RDKNIEELEMMRNKFKQTSRISQGMNLLLFLSFAVALHFLTVPIAAAKDAKSAKAESRFANLDGARVHYVNYGKGNEALVLIHGWTMNLDNWRDQIPDLTKRSRVIAVDLPGHGQSDKPQ